MATIEPATSDDIPQLCALLETLFAQEAEFTPDRAKQERGLRLILASPELGVVLVARDENEASGQQVVGMVGLLFTISTAEGGRAAWLEDMVVRPDRRGAGIGSRLLGAAIDLARRENLVRISLLTDGHNPGAMRFYERAGFTISEMTTLRLQLK